MWVIIIKAYVPSYFKKFHCIADKCTDTCCAGWEVNLDPEATEYYNTLGGDIGKKVNRHLCKDDDGDYIFTLCNNRCPFLNKDNLCELILTIGEDSLSKTCTLFPRFYDDFGTFREMGLGLGCPEAARIILTSDEAYKSLLEYGEAPDTDEDINGELVNFILFQRDELMSIFDEETDFKEKLQRAFLYARGVQDILAPFEDIKTGADFSDCTELLSRMEYISDERKSTVLKLSDEGFDKTVFEKYSDEFARIMKYFLYRYLLKSAYDCDFLTKVKYGAFACAVIGRLYMNCEDRIAAVCGFSKELEYSDINTELLDNAMYESFGTEDLLGLF